jgi:hypothetical protein
MSPFNKLPQPNIVDVSGDAHRRANEAKTDYLSYLPGIEYRRLKEEIESVWHLLESPIEEVAIFQLAAVDYSYGEHSPSIFAKVTPERGINRHLDWPVQIIPQVRFGPYRVDLLYDLGPRGLIAVECDGEDYHQDRERDRVRDNFLRREFRLGVIRLRGKQIWKNADATDLVGGAVTARLV